VRERRSFDSEGRLRRVERLAESGDVVWSARFDDYASVAGASLAHAIRLEAAQPAIRAELVLSGIELNPTLSADLFRLRPISPDGDPDGEGG
jgi:hypothetical protein